MAWNPDVGPSREILLGAHHGNAVSVGRAWAVRAIAAVKRGEKPEVAWPAYEGKVRDIARQLVRQYAGRDEDLLEQLAQVAAVTAGAAYESWRVGRPEAPLTHRVRAIGNEAPFWDRVLSAGGALAHVWCELVEHDHVDITAGEAALLLGAEWDRGGGEWLRNIAIDEISAQETGSGPT